MAALWAERCKAIVAVSGYLITRLDTDLRPLPPGAEWGRWYQYISPAERNRIGYREDRNDFNTLMWKNGSPK